MPISAKIQDSMTRASFIRKMFEEGIRMKQEFGPENVFDFSLGNPILEPPAEVRESLRRLSQLPPSGLHRYMANAGFPEVRARIAAHLTAETTADLTAADIIMTTGAAGALNVALKAILDPGDEVVVIAPYFSEYNFYVDNHGGKLVVAQSTDDFDLDLADLGEKLGPRTKAVLINSPNNPTGRMYDAEALAGLGALLAERSRQIGHPITLLSDDPYRKIVYDGLKAPDPFAAYPHTIFVASHSKDLGLAGERIGYAAISPGHADRQDLQAAMTFAIRTLGYVNAPAMFQHVAADAQSASVPISVYQELRDLFCAGLDRAGLAYFRPQGAFYLFPKSPIADDLEFVQRLKAERVLAVPGSGFGRPGHIRLSFCVTPEEIEGALPQIEKVMQACKS